MISRQLPPMEIPPSHLPDEPQQANWQRQSNQTGVIPSIVRGNSAPILPGQSQVIYQASSPDNEAKVYTLTVFPTDIDPTTLFSSVPITGASPVYKYGAPHNVLIEYGIGGVAAQQLFVDLKKGFRVQLPLSAIKVTVFNAAPAAADPAVYTINVGCSIGAGAGGSSDNLTVTAHVNDLTVAAQGLFIVPPMAESVEIMVGYHDGRAVATDATLEIAWKQQNGPALIPILYDEVWPPQLQPIGPLSIPAGANILDVILTATAHVKWDIIVVWHLGL